MWKLYPRPLKFLATSLPALIVGEENLVIGFAPPPHFKNCFRHRCSVPKYANRLFFLAIYLGMHNEIEVTRKIQIIKFRCNLNSTSNTS